MKKRQGRGPTGPPPVAPSVPAAVLPAAAVPARALPGIVRLAAAALWGAVLLSCVRALEAQEPPDSVVRNPARVTGQVVDVESGEPVPGARVSLAGLAGRPGTRAVDADSTGAFAFRAMEAGPWVLRITRIGYRALTDTIRLTGDAENRVRASMVPAAVDLEPLVVTAVRRTPPFMRDFQRRRARGFGSFITREEIEERDPFVTSDLFRTLPGVRVVPNGAVGGAGLVMRGRCRPQLYIDGIAAGRQVSVDFALQPGDIEAIEVYSNAGVPAQYARNACGVILVWTRVPQPVADGGSFWKRLAVVGGVVLGVFLLNR